MVNISKKHPEYFVITDIDAGFMNKTEVTRCSNFNSAVDIYKKMTSLYGPYCCQIAQEVVGYGEAL